jgi:hypothetical protein
VKRCLALFTFSMASDTVNIRDEHEAGRVRNPDPTASAVEPSRP